MPLITIDFFEGRDIETKRELVKAFTTEACRILDCKPEAVHIMINDVKRENWASAGILWADK